MASKSRSSSTARTRSKHADAIGLLKGEQLLARKQELQATAEAA
jgi:hypothetical protein